MKVVSIEGKAQVRIWKELMTALSLSDILFHRRSLAPVVSVKNLPANTPPRNTIITERVPKTVRLIQIIFFLGCPSAGKYQLPYLIHTQVIDAEKPFHIRGLQNRYKSGIRKGKKNVHTILNSHSSKSMTGEVGSLSQKFKLVVCLPILRSLQTRGLM